jgi:hypothetical protein
LDLDDLCDVDGSVDFFPNNYQGNNDNHHHLMCNNSASKDKMNNSNSKRGNSHSSYNHHIDPFADYSVESSSSVEVIFGNADPCPDASSSSSSSSSAALPLQMDYLTSVDYFNSIPDSSNTATTASAYAANHVNDDDRDDRDDRDDHGDVETSDHQRERIELEQRRLIYIRLFLRADVVYSSPLTRAVQTALMALNGHHAFTKNNLCFYR